MQIPHDEPVIAKKVIAGKNRRTEKFFSKKAQLFFVELLTHAHSFNIDAWEMLCCFHPIECIVPADEKAFIRQADGFHYLPPDERTFKIS